MNGRFLWYRSLGRESWRDSPHALHLFASTQLLHQLIVEIVFALSILCSPDNRFGGMYKVATGEIRRRIGLFPSDVIEYLVSEPLHCDADKMDDMMGSADPYRSIRLQNALTCGEPFGRESEILVKALRAIPLALVHGDHPSGIACNAVVGEEIGRVGENEIHASFGRRLHHIEAIAQIQPYPLLLILEVDLVGRV